VTAGRKDAGAGLAEGLHQRAVIELATMRGPRALPLQPAHQRGAQGAVLAGKEQGRAIQTMGKVGRQARRQIGRREEDDAAFARGGYSPSRPCRAAWAGRPAPYPGDGWPALPSRRSSRSSGTPGAPGPATRVPVPAVGGRWTWTPQSAMPTRNERTFPPAGCAGFSSSVLTWNSSSA